MPAIMAGLVILLSMSQRERWRDLGSGGRRTVGAVVLVVLAVGGAVVEHHYLDHRYVDAGLRHPLRLHQRRVRDTHDERVAVFRTEQLYPMFGNQLSNFVTKVPAPPTTDCRGWRQALADGGFTYVVLGHGGGFTTDPAPDQAWIDSDAAARLVATDWGTSALYRIEGRLDPSTCP